MPLAIAIHHPRPEHRDEWIALMRQAGAASAGIPGLIGTIAGYREDPGGRLVGISHWESTEALEKGVTGMRTMSDQADQAWGEQPTVVLLLSEL
jgi:quinol monooxygenase YgiN